MGKKKIQNNIVSDFGFEEYIAALHKYRKETGRDQLTDEEKNRIAEETRARYYTRDQEGRP